MQNGYGVAVSPNKYTHGTAVGKAIESKSTAEPGLVKSESSHIASVKSTLNSLSGHSFDIPDGISDSVLETFPTIVEGFITTLNDLEENMQKTDVNYKKLNNKISSDFKAFEEITIPKRKPIV